MTNTKESTSDIGQVHTQSVATRFKAIPTLAWIAAAVGGFIGSIPLGLMMQYGNPNP
ncbi:DUF2852 domain-containing protein [Haloarcula sp. CBA1131]|uniref:DUF2852 domain-containing protein n=1 Tax=Haloarcula sp. CBA1131 TaxID=1853686 RepID=UPI001CD9D255|nr:DUF2852 domain-containing protein [Haloarcula sp. CBA1131]